MGRCSVSLMSYLLAEIGHCYSRLGIEWKGSLVMKKGKHCPPEFRHGANSARVARVQGLRRSGSAGVHRSDVRFKGTRGARRRTLVAVSREGG